MMSTFRYKVKFEDTSRVTRYGVVRSFGEDVEEQKKLGMAIVDDAVLPIAYVVPEGSLVDIKSDYGRVDRERGRFVDCDEVEASRGDEYEKARKLAASLPDDGKLHAGDMFQIGVADGYAFYVVTRVNKKSCRVEWRGFGGDGYQDHHFQLGGTFPISDVLRYVSTGRAMAKLFSKKEIAS